MMISPTTSLLHAPARSSSARARFAPSALGHRRTSSERGTNTLRTGARPTAIGRGLSNAGSTGSEGTTAKSFLKNLLAVGELAAVLAPFHPPLPPNRRFDDMLGECRPPADDRPTPELPLSLGAARFLYMFRLTCNICEPPDNDRASSTEKTDPGRPDSEDARRGLE